MAETEARMISVVLPLRSVGAVRPPTAAVGPYRSCVSLPGYGRPAGASLESVASPVHRPVMPGPHVARVGQVQAAVADGSLAAAHRLGLAGRCANLWTP